MELAGLDNEPISKKYYQSRDGNFAVSFPLARYTHHPQNLKLCFVPGVV